MAFTHDRLALGVDGGGTKSDAVLIDEAGTVLGYGRSGTGQSFWAGCQAAQENFAEAIRAALGEYRPASLWIAGLHRAAYDEIEIPVPETHSVPARETTMGLAMALETSGILVLSGTGSFVEAVTDDRRHLTRDGLGPVLGDYGSGYQIGLQGMRAAMASSWSPERATVLDRLIPEAMGVPTRSGIFEMVYVRQIGRRQIASVAEAVLRAAEQGDAVARRITLQAADDISDVLRDVVNELGLWDSTYALVASGGVAQNSRLYWNRVCERALQIAPWLRPVQPKIKPCVGAALLALKEMGVTWSASLLRRTEETMPSWPRATEGEAPAPPSSRRP